MVKKASDASTENEPKDAGTDTGSNSSSCLEPGDECTDNIDDCCEDAVCVTEGDDYSVCAAFCIENDQCVSDCCAPLDNSTIFVCSPPVFCASSISSSICDDLVLVANDGEFLGVASSNEFATDGICNEFSSYGSEFSSTSIFNQFGSYGSQFGQLSAYNEFTRTPPFLYCVSTDEIWNPITKNTFISGYVDPDTLCTILASNGY